MARRRSIHIKGFQHTNPIPNASRIGNMVMSGVILGRNTETGETPETLEGQCAAVFGYMKDTVEAAGGSPDDILKVTVWLKNPGDRTALNAEWTKMFPDPDSRPARHVLPDMLDSPFLISCDFTAIIED